MANNNTIQRAFGAVLRQARKEAQLSQEGLALESGLDRTFISLLERGLRQPTLTSLFTLATSLQLEPHVLVRETEKELRSVRT